MSAKIYTKTGDGGTTSLLGGTRLPKSHVRFHAYGTIDELNVSMGVLVFKSQSNGPTEISKILIQIQNDLFVAGGLLAIDQSQWLEKVPRLTENSILCLESQIDQWTATLPPLRTFILPGGSESALIAHQARTICRRAERWTLEVVDGVGPEFLEEFQRVLRYLNRLSDFLFTYGRWINYQDQIPETPWKPS